MPAADDGSRSSTRLMHLSATTRLGMDQTYAQAKRFRVLAGRDLTAWLGPVCSTGAHASALSASGGKFRRPP
jgi:hypothetical protein